MAELEFHEAANIFPLDEENIDALADDIRKNGQQVPIETLDGKILDGRRRWLACIKADVKPLLREVKPADPVAYVLSLNLHRRHLSPTQLSMVAARARECYDAEAKRRQAEAAKRGGKASGASRRGETKVVENFPQPSDGTKARDQVGEKIGVSGKTVDAATKVLKHGTPKLVEAVEKDRIAVSTAARVASMTEEEQDALADRAAERAAKGDKRKTRPSEKPVPAKPATPEPDPDNNPEDRKVRGKGVFLAHEAINCLTRIPKNDALRKEGLQLVKDWIRRNP